jgi:hypothetical protein
MKEEVDFVDIIELGTKALKFDIKDLNLVLMASRMMFILVK